MIALFAARNPEQWPLWCYSMFVLRTVIFDGNDNKLQTFKKSSIFSPYAAIGKWAYLGRFALLGVYCMVL